MREMSVAEQRYKAVLAVIGDGRTVTEVARDWGISRKALHAWLARYEVADLEGLNDLSHRPAHCPHQMSASVEAKVGRGTDLPARALRKCQEGRPSSPTARSGDGKVAAFVMADWRL
jgi:transposase-like protein